MKKINVLLIIMIGLTFIYLTMNFIFSDSSEYVESKSKAEQVKNITPKAKLKNGQKIEVEPLIEKSS